MLEFIFDLFAFVSFGGIGIVISLVFAVWVLGIWAWEGVIWLGGAIKFTWNANGTKVLFYFSSPWLMVVISYPSLVLLLPYLLFLFVVGVFQYRWAKSYEKIN